MTWIASNTIFTALVFLAITGVVIGASALVVLVLRDWRNGRLW